MSTRVLVDPDPTTGRTSIRSASGPRRWRPLLRLRHLLTLGREILLYSVLHREWWLVPVLVVILLASLLAAVGQAVVPFSVYTLF